MAALEFGSSSSEGTFDDDLISGLIENFFNSMRSFLMLVFQGRSTPTESLKRALLFQIEGMLVVNSGAQIEELRALVEKFGRDVDAWRKLRQTNISPLMQEELSRLKAQHEVRRAENRRQMEAFEEEMGRVSAHTLQNAEELRFTEELIDEYTKNIDKARRSIEQAQAFLATTEPKLNAEAEKLLKLHAVAVQLEEETARKRSECEELELRFVQELSLSEAHLESKALEKAKENIRLQMQALEVQLNSYTQKRI